MANVKELMTYIEHYMERAENDLQELLDDSYIIATAISAFKINYGWRKLWKTETGVILKNYTARSLYEDLFSTRYLNADIKPSLADVKDALIDKESHKDTLSNWRAAIQEILQSETQKELKKKYTELGTPYKHIKVAEPIVRFYGTLQVGNQFDLFKELWHEYQEESK